MTTVDFFVDDDRERRKRRGSAIVVVAVAGAVVILARKPAEVPARVEPPHVVKMTPTPATKLPTEVLAPAPSTPAPQPVVIEMPPLTTTHASRPKPTHVAIAQPQPEPQPQPQTPPQPQPQTPAPPPLPPLQLLVDPRALHFTVPSWKMVTITNPNAEAMHLDRVAIAGTNHNLYQLDTKSCLGITLEPHQSCRVGVLATALAVAAHETIRIEVAASREAQH